MAIDKLLGESRITLNKLAHEEGVALSTAWRWAQRGVRGVKLETISVGAKRVTSREAFSRFVSLTTAAASRRPPPNATRLRAAEIAAAKNEVQDLLTS